MKPFKPLSDAWWQWFDEEFAPWALIAGTICGPVALIWNIVAWVASSW